MSSFYRKGEAACPIRQRPAGSPLLSVLFFPVSILYQELLLRLFDKDTNFFDLALVRIALFSAAAGLILFLILDLIPKRKPARIAGGAVIFLWTTLLCIERGCRDIIGQYYTLGFMGKMAVDVTRDFGGVFFTSILGLAPFVLLSAVPFLVFVPLRHKIIRDDGQKKLARLILAAAAVLCQLLGWALSAFGIASSYYTYGYTANSSIAHFGAVTTIRLELEYAIFGVPMPPLPTFTDAEFTHPPATPAPSASVPPTAHTEPTAEITIPPAPEYGFNQLDIDFAGLAEQEEDETIQTMHRYFGGLTPSQKNEYTGMFQGKNLILITAEGFSPAAIDKDLTPTLYKLTHEGFIFHNYYQPDWTQSTCGGEFAVTTGLIPNWIGSSMELAAQASASVSMPNALPKLFAPLGYSTPAWHNHTYTYYERNTYLENFGYDFKAKDHGMELAHPELWPESDLEMMLATCDSYIDDYVENGKLFHAYYMTVSGHGKYNWSDNAISAMHREAVEAKFPDLSETSQAYLACNIELDLALEHLVSKLEQAGIANDTLIVMTGDHYPYLMVEDDVDYYNELRGFEDTEKDTSRFRNTLLMWSGAIQEPIEVDTPCSSIDIVPTLCNLFGLDYDSRLYSGRDIFAPNYEVDQASTSMPLVVFANTGFGSSWITAAGTYEASTDTFIPNEGVEVGEDYVSNVSLLVNAKISYAKLILEQDYFSTLFPDD